MPLTRTLGEIGRIGDQIYRERIRPIVMPEHKGEYAAIDIDSSDYEIDPDDIAAEDRLRSRRPNMTGYVIRVGYKEAGSFGGRLTEGG